jgi:hypothetical protein
VPRYSVVGGVKFYQVLPQLEQVTSRVTRLGHRADAPVTAPRAAFLKFRLYRLCP